MACELMARATKLKKALIDVKKTLLLLVAILIVTTASVACNGEETFSLAENVDDGTHAFQVKSATLVESVGEDVPPEDHSYLIIELEIENIHNRQDSLLSWVNQVTVETDRGAELELVTLSGLEGQLENATLLPGQKAVGKMSFDTKDDVRDFELTFRFPVSGTVSVYEFRAEDERLSVYVDYILDRMKQRYRVRSIPVIGGVVERFNRASIQYYGEVFVPKDEIPGLLEQLEDLTEEAQRQVISDYVRENKGWAQAE